MPDLKTNVLYYGDNLDILRHHIPPESVDLIYLDPPFNSNRSYNVLFKETGGTASEAQIEAFEDTWKWGPTAQNAYEQVVTGPNQEVARMLKAMVEGLGYNDMTAYLSMMAIRLIELHRVLNGTGSLYLHCDPTASHYLKLISDSVFGPTNFRNEITWKRTHAHSGARRYGPVHDVLLFYSKSDQYVWYPQYTDYSREYTENFFKFADSDGRRYRATILTGSGTRRGSSGLPWRGIDPTKSGRHWAIPGYARDLLGSADLPDVQSALEKLDSIGRVLWPNKKGGVPSFKQYIDDMEGVELQDVWTDILPLSAQAKERLGYPTQKPLALLERIIAASSKAGDVVLDPFCGCGTAVHAAEKLDRNWIGIDITHLAIGLIRRRMTDAFPSVALEVVGEPADLQSALVLAHRDKYQFQWWVCDKIGALPVSGKKKKGADQGRDGLIPFFAAQPSEYKQAIVSVKAGDNVGVGMVRELIAVLKQQDSPIGVLITVAPATKPMIAEAATESSYENPFWQKSYPRIQLLTIEEIMAGKRPKIPPGKSPFAKAIREEPADAYQAKF